jgi:hypothetical protein
LSRTSGVRPMESALSANQPAFVVVMLELLTRDDDRRRFGEDSLLY